jgi:hypothetical protein
MTVPTLDASRIAGLLGQSGTSAHIATLDENGTPRTVPSPFLELDDQGRLVHLELLETSATHRNLLRSTWFDLPVSITLAGADGSVLSIAGRPHKAHISGPLFSDYYRRVREQLGDADLAAVWLIRPEQATDETYAHQKTREERLHPFHLHLDRLALQ